MPPSPAGAKLVVKLLQSRGGDVREPAQQQGGADAEEQQDGGNLEDGEPELELAEVLHPGQVDGREQGHEDQRQRPDGDHRPDREEEACGAKGLGGDDDHELQPPEPADRGACGLSHGLLRVDGECSAVGVGGGHLAQGPHDQDDQGSGDEVGDQYGRAGGLDAGSGAEEQAGADRAARVPSWSAGVASCCGRVSRAGRSAVDFIVMLANLLVVFDPCVLMGPIEFTVFGAPRQRGRQPPP